MRRARRWIVVLLLVGAVLATVSLVLRRRNPPAMPQATAEASDLAARLAAHVQTLAGEIGPRHVRRPAALAAAQRYIEQRLLELDYRLELQSFDAAGATVANVEAFTAPASQPYFVVGAHYDTVPTTPGANDNASGVAVMLEVARLLRRSPEASRIRFVAFVNEEPPWFQTPLMGSLVYAARAKERGDNVVGMVSLETMGYYSNAPRSQEYPAPFHLFYPETAHFLAAVSNFGSFGLLRGFSRGFKAASPLPLIATPAPTRIPGVGWSDHWAFWEHDYRALVLTDTAFFRYAHYHTASDTPDKLDYVRLAYAVQGVASAVSHLAH